MTGTGSRFLLSAFLCLTLAAPAHAEKRVALVIGNGFYQYQPILSNPKHDAEDVAQAFRDLKFDVVLGLDLKRADMNEKLDEFSRKADGADIAFVYYSGHGMQLGGSNYLLPTDASLDSAADVNPFRLVRIDSVMETLSKVNGPKIVVLDACRDNPVANELKRKLATLRGTKGAEVTRGLSPISASGSGLLVAYATQAEETALDGKGRNSPFTAAFIKNVADPDTDIRQMFFHVQDEVVRETDGKQRPEISVSLVGEYKLKITITPIKPTETLSPAVAPAAPVAGNPGEAERAWGYVKDTTSPNVLEDFIRQYGSTVYGSLARARLEELKKSQAAMVSPPAAPAARGDVKDDERDWTGKVQEIINRFKDKQDKNVSTPEDVTEHAIKQSLNEAVSKANLNTFESFVGENWTADRLRVKVLETVLADLDSLFNGNNRGYVPMQQLDTLIQHAAEVTYRRVFENSELLAANRSKAAFVQRLYQDLGARVDDDDIHSILGNAAGAALGKYEVVFRRSDVGNTLRYRAERIVFDCLSENVIKIFSSETGIATPSEIQQRIVDTVKTECVSWLDHQFGSDPRSISRQRPMPLRVVWSASGPMDDPSMYGQATSELR
jgi:hypothetical protein